VWQFNIIGLDKVCDRCVLEQNPWLGGRDIDSIRAGRLLYFIHHHTNSWNIQHPPPPSVIDGFALIEDYDIHGFDIGYVEYPPGGYGDIAGAAAGNPEVVAFNYNGYLKGRGGRLEACRADNHWIKAGMRPWVCVKREFLAELGGIPRSN
jgi:hypothetical protein